MSYYVLCRLYVNIHLQDPFGITQENDVTDKIFIEYVFNRNSSELTSIFYIIILL
jgi:hypothetical protein